MLTPVTAIIAAAANKTVLLEAKENLIIETSQSSIQMNWH